MNTDADILKQQSTELENELKKVLDCYLDVLGWVSLFTMLGNLAIRRKDSRAVGIMLFAVERISQRNKR